MGDLVRVELGDGSGQVPSGVATIHLERPPMNALNTQLQEELRVAAAQLGSDDAVRAVVIYGGEKIFAAGADVKEFATMSHTDMVRDAERLSTSFTALARIPKPVIAAVTGYALGGGCELALTADFRVSADTAQWGQPEILLGIIPGGGGTQRLARLIGPAKAKDLIYTGRFVPAAEALEIGLVDVLVPADQVYSVALAIAAKYAKGPALALRAAKAAIDGGLDGSLDAGLRLESQLFTSLFASEDRTIGMSSFLESGPGKGEVHGDGGVTATAEQVQAAWSDPKLANVLYHDWEAATYDEKWSISYDQRCVDYARDRFTHVAGESGWPYPKSLELGCGTGFFTLNLKLAGVISEAHVTDLSPAMVEVAERNADRLGFQVFGRVADAERLPYDDDSFDLVIGHAVLHHIPDVDLALREVLRVLKPGGRFVFAGEPTRHGDFVARRLSRATWWATTHATRLPGLAQWRRPHEELAESARAAALESVVDLHTFEPAELRRCAQRTGAVDVQVATVELLASWFGWPVRTFECAVPKAKLGLGWATFAMTMWRRLSAIDEKLARVVPEGLFYNVEISAMKPSA